jgi:uncharacterized protein YegP (UPF0339 family)
VRIRPVKRLVVYTDRAGEWRWKVRAANYRTISISGEGFASLYNAVKSARDNFTDLPITIKHRKAA